MVRFSSRRRIFPVMQQRSESLVAGSVCRQIPANLALVAGWMHTKLTKDQFQVATDLYYVDVNKKWGVHVADEFCGDSLLIKGKL
jgi:hypothetical protein